MTNSNTNSTKFDVLSFSPNQYNYPKVVLERFDTIELAKEFVDKQMPNSTYYVWWDKAGEYHIGRPTHSGTMSEGLFYVPPFIIIPVQDGGERDE